MAKTIRKRDGRTVEFEKQKITNAVRKALQKVEADTADLAEQIATLVESECSDSEETVESVQDKVEKALIEKNLPEAAKEYILYRNKRSEIREQETSLMKTLEGLFAERGDSIKENANINGTTVSGLYYRIGSEASKDFYKKHLLSEDVRKAFEDGYIHIHDFDYYGLSLNCMQHDLGQMFKKGFFSGNCFITEPQSITTAMMLTCVVLQSGQTDLFGGESIPAWDYYMDPYVQRSFEKYFSTYLQRFNFAPVETQKKWIKEYPYLEHTPVFENDDLYRCYSWAKKDTEKETYQAAQAMVFNFSGLCSRSGGQVVFSSLNLGTCIRAGARLAMKALFAAMDKGIGKGITAFYPIVIFKLKDGVSYSPKDPNYDLRLLAEKTTAKRQYPNFSNLDAPYNLKYYREGHPETEATYMGMAAKGRVQLELQDKKGRHLCYIQSDISEVWDLLTRLLKLPAKQFDSVTEWINLEAPDMDYIINIKDSSSEGYVRAKKYMRCTKPFNGERWKYLQAIGNKNGERIALVLTSDHPLSVWREDEWEGCRRVPVKDLSVGDHLEAGDSWDNGLYTIYRIGNLKEEPVGYDFETASDKFDLDKIVSHNCRTRVIANVNGPEIVTGRGNLSFTTINLPRLAIEAQQEAIEPELREGIFFKKLEEVMAIATKQLQERFELQCKRHVYNFPYVMQQGAYMGSEYLSPGDTIEKAILNGTLSFGFVGLAETLVALTGHDHADGEDYQQLGLKIIKYMRDYADKLTEERHMNWTLIATPAESVAGRFLRLDRAKYGIIPGVTDKDYYTNSNHVPVGKKVTASEKIRIEAPYHALCNAGHILYNELEGDPRDNLDAMHMLVNQMHDAGAGYFSFNAKMDTCTNCGYTGIIGDICPSCGQKETPSHPFMRPRRITGYLSNLSRFNSAKLAEVHDRVTHA